MTHWLFLLVLPFGSLAYAAVLFYKRWLAHEEAKERAQINKAIAERGMRQVFTGQDDALRVTAERRRAAADDKRRQAKRIESGEPIEQRIRIVR